MYPVTNIDPFSEPGIGVGPSPHDFFRHLTDVIDVHLRVMCATGGDLSTLLPMLVDAGINGLWISNIMSANMEYPKLRREYGPEVALIAGIDARALSRDEPAHRFYKTQDSIQTQSP